eukprot:3220408-Pyramimonas_sp.AAC.1
MLRPPHLGWHEVDVPEVHVRWDIGLVVGDIHQVAHRDAESSAFAKFPTCRAPGSAIEVQVSLVSNVQIGTI